MEMDMHTFCSCGFHYITAKHDFENDVDKVLTPDISMADMRSSQCPIDKLRQTIQNLGDGVVRLSLDSSIIDKGDRMYLISSYLRRARKLQELSVDCSSTPTEWAKRHDVGDALFDALKGAPCLKRLKLAGVSFSSPGVVEEFFETVGTLSILHLRDILVREEDGASVANAFRRGLHKTSSLEEVSLKRKGMDSRLYEEILYGLAQHSKLQRLALVINSSYSDQGGKVERSLIQSSTSLEFLAADVEGEDAQIQVLLGVAQSSSIREFVLEGSKRCPSQDSELANTFTELFVRNSTLRVLDLRFLQLGPCTEQALASGLATGLEKLFLAHITFQGGSDLMFRFRNVNVVHLNNVEFKSGPSNPKKLRCRQPAKMKTFFQNSSLTTTGLSALLCPPSSPPLRDLVLADCALEPHAATVLSNFILASEYLETLRLSGNDGLGRDIGHILDAICKCPSMRKLRLEGMRIRLEDCAEHLGRLFEESQLTYLALDEGNYAPRKNCVMAIAQSLRKNTKLEELFLPYVSTAHVGILGDAFTENDTLHSLHVEPMDCLVEEDDDATTLVEFDESGVLAFIQAMPRMDGLRRLDGVLECESNERLERALISSMGKNTTLRSLSCAGDLLSDCPEAQFYANLNYFGRAYILHDNGSTETIPGALWPRILSRMSLAEHSSELYHVLSKRVDLLLPQGDHSFWKRKTCGGKEDISEESVSATRKQQ